LRPTHIASCIILTGSLAALPFYRSADDGLSESAPQLATGPQSDPDGLVTGASSRHASADFDQSMAWQPIPMVLPQRQIEEQPVLPDSYYDLSIPWEQPDPIRERYSAAMRQPANDGLASAGLASDGPASAGPDRIPGAESAGVTEFASQSTPVKAVAAKEDENIFNDPDPIDEFRKWAADSSSPTQLPDPTTGIIEDRFVFEPIHSLPAAFPAAATTAAGPGRDGTPAQSVSTGRVLPTAPSDGERPRYFIREPD
jgi:hypothetical protein